MAPVILIGYRIAVMIFEGEKATRFFYSGAYRDFVIETKKFVALPPLPCARNLRNNVRFDECGGPIGTM